MKRRLELMFKKMGLANIKKEVRIEYTPTINVEDVEDNTIVLIETSSSINEFPEKTSSDA